MPYLVSSIIAVVSAMIIMFTRYEADDSTITAELDRVKSMFSMVDGFVNTYIQSGGNLSDINFEVLFNAGILPGNVQKSDPAQPLTDNVIGDGFSSVLSFPSSSVRWQLIPVRDYTPPPDNTDFGDSAGSAYKLLVDMSQNPGLMSKAIFAESFSSREFCEKMLFGTVRPNVERLLNEFDLSTVNFLSDDGTDRDGIFVCIVFK